MNWNRQSSRESLSCVGLSPLCTWSVAEGCHSWTLFVIFSYSISEVLESLWWGHVSWSVVSISGSVYQFTFYFALFIFIFFRATPAVHESSWARVQIGAAAADLQHSHSNARSERAACETCTAAHGHTRSLIHWARPGMEPISSWLLVRFITRWATAGTPYFTF